MPTYRAIVTLATTNGINEDSPQNTFHFVSGDDPGPFVAIDTALRDFYNSWRGDLSSTIAVNGHRMRFYDLADPEPRAPVYDVNWNLSGSVGSNTLPQEVSICLSFQGDRISGVSQARRRGRLYLGPLRSAVVDTSTGRPTSSFLEVIQLAGNGLLADSNAAAEWSWVIRSQRDNANVPVTNGWVDNAFDTQRRRGLTPTSRLTYIGT